MAGSIRTYGLAVLGASIEALGTRFQTFAAYAGNPVDRVFGSAPLRQALHYQADTFASVWLRNDGDGRFTVTELPTLAQIAPIRAIVVRDLDGDGNLDLLVAGNLCESEPNTPRADAGKGLWLKGDGRGNFAPVPPTESGFLAPFNVRDMGLVTTRSGRAVLVANHASFLQAFEIRRSPKR